MTAPRPRFAYIQRLTERLLAEDNVIAAPVPVEAMAKSRGCKVVTGSLHPYSGLLMRSREGTVIGVNEDHPPVRRRFTVAHELGHLLLHEGQQIRYDLDFKVNLRSKASSEGKNVEEIEANFFASSLLMPEAMLEADPRTAFIHLDDDAALETLAKAYKVSRQAMTIRLTRLVGRQG